MYEFIMFLFIYAFVFCSASNPNPFENRTDFASHKSSATPQSCPNSNFLNEIFWGHLNHGTSLFQGKPKPENLLEPEAQKLADALQEMRDFVKKFEKENELTDLTLLDHFMPPIYTMIPHYGYENAPPSFYQNVTRINQGVENLIFKATLAHNRSSICKGETVALRVARLSPGFSRFNIMQLLASLHLSKLREDSVSDFIPDIHGVYFTSCFPADEEIFRCKPGFQLFFIEMDYIESSYLGKYYLSEDLKETIPVSPRVAFEEVIGRWAVAQKGQCSIDDPDGNVPRHRLLHHDSQFLVYQLGNKTYLFPPGYSPRQVDFDNFRFNFYFDGPRKHLIDHVDSPSIKAFLSDIPDKGILCSAYDNLQDFEVSSTFPLPKSGIKHRKLSEEDFRR